MSLGRSIQEKSKNHFVTWSFKEISSASDSSGFDCGIPALNDYLKLYAKQNHKYGIGKTCVAVDKNDAVQGYYTLSSAEVLGHLIPKDISNKLPKYPVPAIRIGRLAVHIKMQGKGLGKELLMHSLTTAVEASQKVGVYLIIVDAKDDTAGKFYQKYGFRAFSSNPHSLFIPVKTIRETK